ncbi:NAD(P)-binding domain-containing protein [Flavihumibacter fluvii]|nr:NAD(P)-binding domain-containing protein [Flavihumibacter fluvii]ULQ54031.1 NAD(P)-binding domain-containing protein [Flavihumibacter fluvii]
MITRQTIAIIGATGNMGAALAKRLAKGNYRILLFGKKENTLQELEQSIIRDYPFADIEPITCSYAASWEADIILLAVPYVAEKEIAARIRDVANQKIVISITNPLNENFDGLLTPSGSSAAEELQKLLPHSKVIKAFNTIFAAELAAPAMNTQSMEVPVAGDDAEALSAVCELVQIAGFRPVIKGTLAASRLLEAAQLEKIIALHKQPVSTQTLK